MRKENLATYHNLNYSIDYYSLTKKGGPDPPGSAPGKAPCDAATTLFSSKLDWAITPDR